MPPTTTSDRPAAGAVTGRVAWRFLLVGGLAFLIDVVCYNLARQLLETGPLTSKSLAFVVSATFAFLGNRLWVFDQRERRQLATAYTLFFLVNVAGLVVNLVPLAVSTYVFDWTSAVAENVSGNLVGVALATLFRFWGYERWVFPRETPAEAREPRRTVGP
ncbi:GtrA family protein [Nocardioides sp. Arc9.136]|uniref:GtrA family protein n=1 Tax=Nocardioides sp. Arc9.136 TaxID=2996826 RepID=UPI002665E80B|nr:GtrA family protein [Nocardioides sp. Arc9.136]WKN48025.1 GtrA family protein [Nocardioides sp. Arc9.136]